MNVLNFNRLDLIKRRIEASHERANKGGAEWVEGSLQLMIALREGKDYIPPHITFKNWLITNKLDFYSKDERSALLGLSTDLELARQLLTESKTQSYLTIWREHKNKFVKQAPKEKRKPVNRNMNRAAIYRSLKLGEDLVESLKGTSLDSAAELDELVVLNRGAAQGELTDIVQHLTAEAVAGKNVSALAYTASLGTTRKHIPTLHEAWRKNMVYAWKCASKEERTKFLTDMMDHIDEGTSHE